MTLNKFKKEYSGAPYELHHFAAEAQNVPHTELKAAAIAFLEAREDFMNILEKLGIEQG